MVGVVLEVIDVEVDKLMVVVTRKHGQCFALLERPKEEALDAVIIGIILVCYRYASILFDPGSKFSFVSIYITFSYDNIYGSLVST